MHDLGLQALFTLDGVLEVFALLLMLLDVFVVRAIEIFVATDDILEAVRRDYIQFSRNKRTSMRTFFITSPHFTCSYRFQKVATSLSLEVAPSEAWLLVLSSEVLPFVCAAPGAILERAFKCVDGYNDDRR